MELHSGLVGPGLRRPTCEFAAVVDADRFRYAPHCPRCFTWGSDDSGVWENGADRKTNAFAKHNRLIASIDTLKRPARLKKILEAPRWDLIVFDEAHHLTAYQSATKVSKTLNFKLAEALRDHSRDLLLLSATPHQGDHFRFWMLVRLLDPSLFLSTEDMLHNRYRLNSVVFRRTQADA